MTFTLTDHLGPVDAGAALRADVRAGLTALDIGDEAILEPDGTISLLGRGSQCINSGGEKIFPEEVESALKAHPAVFDAGQRPRFQMGTVRLSSSMAKRAASKASARWGDDTATTTAG